MSQNFTVVETQTEKKGTYVPVKQTVADVRGILDGKADSCQPEDLMFIGPLKDIEDKLAPKHETLQVTQEIVQKPPDPPAPVPQAGQ